MITGVVKYDTHEESFAIPDSTRHIWIVYTQYPTGKIERVAAYFSERTAREYAGSIVGKDGLSLIGIEKITVCDNP